MRNCELTLSNNNFMANFYGIDTYESTVSISDSQFINNWGDNIVTDSSNIQIKNITVNNSNEIMNTLDCDIRIENSTFTDNNLIWFYNSEVLIYNTTFIEIVEGIYFYNASATIKNSRFENCYYCLWLTEMKTSALENNSFYDCSYSMIEIRNSKDITLKNNKLIKTLWGIMIYDSSVLIENNTIMNSSLTGISESGSKSIIRNNLLSNNSVGIYTVDSTSLIMNNTIVGNHVGITCYISLPQIVGNLIADNADWGLNITNFDPVLHDNSFSDEQYPQNGLGRIIRYGLLELSVQDSYGNIIRGVKIQVKNNENKLVIDEAQYINKKTVSYLIPIYEILNSGSKKNYNPFWVSGLWGTEEYGYTHQSKSVDLTEGATVNLTLTLPDLYVNSEDIRISNLNPKHGDNIEFEVTIHYQGNQVDAKDIEVSLTANGGIVKRFPVSFNASSEPQNQTFTIPWKVVAFESDKMNIRVVIDQTNKLENHELNYDDNNIATTSLDVEGKELSTGMGISLIQFCGIVILIVVLLFLLFLFLMIRSKAKTQRDQAMMTPDEFAEKRTSITIKREDKPEDEANKKVEDKDSTKRKVGPGPRKKQKPGPKKTMKEKLREDLNRPVPPRIKW